MHSIQRQHLAQEICGHALITGKVRTLNGLGKVDNQIAFDLAIVPDCLRLALRVSQSGEHEK